jgi:hypothetical protein
MSLEWNEDVIVTFLEEYQKYECLWNPYHRCYKDCFAKSEALKKIENTLKYNVTVRDYLDFLRKIREKLSF